MIIFSDVYIKIVKFPFRELLASTCSSLLLPRKRVQQNYRHFFKDCKPKSAFWGLKKLRALVKTLLMEIILELKISINLVKTKKACLCTFADL